jgi:prepilin-type N-terminal cleavage/methylation domain-containing protein
MGVLRRLAAREDGFTIIELMAALSVLAIGFFTLASAMGLGLREVALGRQRQSATEIANARLEHLRNLAYDDVELSSQPTHSTDPSNPDSYVSNDNASYDVTGKGAYEPLVVDTTNGQVLHLEDPVTVGTTQMSVYQYVTWVDDPSISGTQNYKRITVVVVFKQPSINGIAQFVRASSFVTTGDIVVSGSGADPNIGVSASPTASPSPSPSPSGPCTGDTTPPSGDFTIVSGTGSETGYTASTSVALNVAVTDPCTPVTAQFSNDGVTFATGILLVTNPQTVAWTVPNGEGSKSIWGRFSDGLGNTKTTGPYVIVLDTTKPTVPGTLTYTKSCSGSNRTVNLSWGSSTDTNFRGYRIYRSINSGAWTAIGTSSTTTTSDTQSKTLDSIAYKVVGYDKAGNESNATNIISLTKNQC